MKTTRVTCIISLGVAAAAILTAVGGIYSEYWRSPASRRSRPNIVILLADDSGYADFQSYGHPSQEWTGVDRMAKEGTRFTNWYTPESLCTPSRAALLTGRYPIRSGVYGRARVFTPISSGGLPKKEVTIPEALKDAGYATGMVGKWHLGINDHNATDGAHLPRNHGFDYVGTNLPFTQLWHCNPEKFTVPEMKMCFVYYDDKIIEQPINLQTLTSRLLNDTKTFITKNKDNSFFFLLSFPQTHAALFSSAKFAGSSRRGPYGDNINEIGWAVDEVLNHLIELGINKDSLVIFLSDHGPVKDGCGEEGAMGVFRGGKETTWEGGVRVPAVAWWPETIPSERLSHAVVSTMDLFPTSLKLAGIKNDADANKLLDGKAVDNVFRGETEESPHEILFFYSSDVLTAVRYQRYKIHYYTIDPLVDGLVNEGEERCLYRDLRKVIERFRGKDYVLKQDPPLIFDVEADPGEYIRLDPFTRRNQYMLKTVDALIGRHQASITPVHSEIDRPVNKELAPCCDPPSCVCNYNEGQI